MLCRLSWFVRGRWWFCIAVGQQQLVPSPGPAASCGQVTCSSFIQSMPTALLLHGLGGSRLVLLVNLATPLLGHSSGTLSPAVLCVQVTSSYFI